MNEKCAREGEEERGNMSVVSEVSSTGPSAQCWVGPERFEWDDG